MFRGSGSRRMHGRQASTSDALIIALYVCELTRRPAERTAYVQTSFGVN